MADFVSCMPFLISIRFYLMWIKNIVVELAITAVIALAAIGDIEWARWIVLIYTPFG